MCKLHAAMMSKDILAYEFGNFHLNINERLLLRFSQIVHLTPKIFDILLLLVRKKGRLVTKEELMREIWPNCIVEDNNLTVSISALRKALNDQKGQRKYIETIPKRGYRFVADIKEVRKNLKLEAEGEHQAGKDWRQGIQEKEISSIAVLPFGNASDDPNLEYLCDGITESLINSLSQLHSLKVMAHSTVLRYADATVDPLKAAQEGGAMAVLVGTVGYSKDLVIKMELVDASDGSRIWSEQYKRGFNDIVTTHGEIAEELSEKLKLKVSDEERRLLAKQYTVNSEACHCYLKGRYFWNKYTFEGLTKAIEYFQQSIKIDRNYALAYAGLADAYLRISNSYLSPKESLPKARAAAQKAVELDPELSEAHTSLGLLKVYYDHDWEGAEAEYKRAIELNPGASLAHKRYGESLLFMGRFAEALAEYKKALSLEPLSLQINANLGVTLFLMRRYDEAIEQLEKTLELDPDYCPSHFALGCLYVQMGNFDDAIEEMRRACKLVKDSSLPLGFLGYAYAMAGRRDEAKRILRRLRRTPKGRYVSPYSVAIIYIGLEERDLAIKWLEKTYEEQSDWLVWFGVGPELDSLRSDPRFEALMKLVGFNP
jgi:DNA-binding winged helix-turn-helix (wHTH) protein/Flp pilus assembly protein TadD